MGDVRNKKVAVVIPARNEASRIGEVIRAALDSKLIDEVIVVDDASTDGTSAEAAKYPNVHVITLPTNLGKAGAMATGVKSTQASVLAFVDADLGGLRSQHLDRFITPVIRDECDMCVGIFKGGKIFSDAAQRVSPYLSGQRAVKRELFEAIPFMEELGMGIEVALNRTAKKRKARVLRVILRGVSNCHKEQKVGFVKGMEARLKMYGEITQAVVRSGKKRKRRRKPPKR